MIKSWDPIGLDECCEHFHRIEGGSGQTMKFGIHIGGIQNPTLSRYRTFATACSKYRYIPMVVERHHSGRKGEGSTMHAIPPNCLTTSV